MVDKNDVSTVKANDLEQVKRFIEQDERLLHVRDDEGRTVLHHALMIENISIFSYLFDAGADLNARNKDGKTVFQLAVEIGRTDILQLIFTQQNLNFYNEKDLGLIVSAPNGVESIFAMLKKRQCPILPVLFRLLTTPTSKFIDVCPEKERGRLSKAIKDRIAHQLNELLKDKDFLLKDKSFSQIIFDIILDTDKDFPDVPILPEYIAILAKKRDAYVNAITNIPNPALFLEEAFKALNPATNIGRILWHTTETRVTKSILIGRAPASYPETQRDPSSIKWGGLAQVFSLITARASTAIQEADIEALSDLKNRLTILISSIEAAKNLQVEQKKEAIERITNLISHLKLHLPVISVTNNFAIESASAPVILPELYPNLVEQEANYWANASAPPARVYEINQEQTNIPSQPVDALVNQAAKENISNFAEKLVRSDKHKTKAKENNNPTLLLYNEVKAFSQMSILSQKQRKAIALRIWALIDSDANPTECDRTGNSALYYAIKSNNVALVKKLLGSAFYIAGVIHAVNKAKKELAISKEVQQELESYINSNMQYKNKSPLFFAAATGNITLFNKVLAYHVKKRPSLQEMQELITIATKHAKFDMVRHIFSRFSLKYEDNNFLPLFLKIENGTWFLASLFAAKKSTIPLLMPALFSKGISTNNHFGMISHLINQYFLEDTINNTGYDNTRLAFINFLSNYNHANITPFLTWLADCKDYIPMFLHRVKGQITRIDYILACLTPDNALGKIFWTKRQWFGSPNLGHGKLYDLRIMLECEIKKAVTGNKDVNYCNQLLTKLTQFERNFIKHPEHSDIESYIAVLKNIININKIQLTEAKFVKPKIYSQSAISAIEASVNNMQSLPVNSEKNIPVSKPESLSPMVQPVTSETIKSDNSTENTQVVSLESKQELGNNSEPLNGKGKEELVIEERVEETNSPANTRKNEPLPYTYYEEMSEGESETEYLSWFSDTEQPYTMVISDISDQDLVNFLQNDEASSSELNKPNRLNVVRQALNEGASTSGSSPAQAIAAVGKFSPRPHRKPVHHPLSRVAVPSS